MSVAMEMWPGVLAVKDRRATAALGPTQKRGPCYFRDDRERGPGSGGNLFQSNAAFREASKQQERSRGTQEEASTMNRRAPGWASTCSPGLTSHWPSQGFLSSCRVSGGTGRQTHMGLTPELTG